MRGDKYEGASESIFYFFFFFQAEDGIRDVAVTGVQTCALPILREGDVLVLGPELGVVVRLPRRGVHPGRAHVAQVDHRVGAAKVLPVLIAIRPGQVGDHQPGHLLAAPGRGGDVDRHQIPPLRELLEHPLAHVTGGSGDHDASFGHLRPPLDYPASDQHYVWRSETRQRDARAGYAVVPDRGHGRGAEEETVKITRVEAFHVDWGAGGSRSAWGRIWTGGGGH